MYNVPFFQPFYRFEHFQNEKLEVGKKVKFYFFCPLTVYEGRNHHE